MQSLAGKVAVVTWASRGAGRGITSVLGEAGATVYVTGRSVSRDLTQPELHGTTIEETAEPVTARGGTDIPVRVDHTVDAEIASLFERVGHARSARSAGQQCLGRLRRLPSTRTSGNNPSSVGIRCGPQESARLWRRQKLPCR